MSGPSQPTNGGRPHVGRTRPLVRSDFFVVYSDGRDTALGGLGRLQNRSFVPSLTELVRF